MIQEQEIVEVALCFAGRQLTDGEAKVLSILCAAALDSWRGQLRQDVAEESIRDLLVVASAWTALAAVSGALEQSSPTPLSFSAGDLTVRSQEGQGGDACAKSLRNQAEALMLPYVRDEAFAFWEVRG